MGKLDYATFLQGNAKESLQELPDESVQTAITSPPYWGLRDYDEEDQIGLEDSPEEYVSRLVDIFRELRRTLCEDGTFWLNIGDSYWAGKGKNGSSKARRTAEERGYNQSSGTPEMTTRPQDGTHPVIKPKDLVGIPWRLAFALQEDGWYLRSDIIWNKPAPMPESVKDRPTSSHEHIFLLTKNKKYFYDHDAIREPLKQESVERAKRGVSAENKRVDGAPGQTPNSFYQPQEEQGGLNKRGKNKRDVWTVTTDSFQGAHFAVFPAELIEPCVKAGTSAAGQCSNCGAPLQRKTETEEIKRYRTTRLSESKFQNAQGLQGSPDDHKGTKSKTVGWEKICGCDTDETERQTVLDPFSGAATTGIAALKHGRKYTGIELNADYIDLSKNRIRNHEEVPTNHDFW